MKKYEIRFETKGQHTIDFKFAFLYAENKKQARQILLESEDNISHIYYIKIASKNSPDIKQSTT